MKTILSEKNIVVILFVMVLVTFSLAQEDTKKMEKLHIGTTAGTASKLLVHQPELKKRESTEHTPLAAAPVE
jgi:ABC-type metal ion transport system substrate-binding protein